MVPRQNNRRRQQQQQAGPGQQQQQHQAPSGAGLGHPAEQDCEALFQQLVEAAERATDFSSIQRLVALVQQAIAWGATSWGWRAESRLNGWLRQHAPQSWPRSGDCMLQERLWSLAWDAAERE
jgi:hypothetical protein